MKYNSYDIFPEFTKYVHDNTLALKFICSDDYSLYGVPTVNLDTPFLTNERCAFIDTNNFGENIVNWLVEHEFGKPTGNYQSSGFCIYPEFEFSEEAIEKYTMED